MQIQQHTTGDEEVMSQESDGDNLEQLVFGDFEVPDRMIAFKLPPAPSKNGKS